MASHVRVHRVAQALRDEIAQLIQREVKDPRIAQVTITGVEVSRDLGHAKVYFSLLDEKQTDKAAVSNCLNRAAGFLKRRIAEDMQLRTVPALSFRFDPAIEQGRRVDDLLNKL